MMPPLTWPKRAAGAIVRLFRPLQDVDIFVEDANDEPLYTELVSRILQGAGVRFFRVFSCGSKADVIARADSHNATKRRAVYLIDGDYAWVRGEPDPLIANVCRLDAYCVENLLLSESACTSVAAEQLFMAQTQVNSALRFTSWRNEVKSLVDLFVVYAAVNRIAPDLPTIKRGLGGILTQTDKGARLDPLKLTRHIVEISNEAASVAGTERLDAELSSVRSRVSQLSEPLLIVSGKDFLMPLFHMHLNLIGGDKCTRRNLRIRLAKKCEIEGFVKLRNMISAAAAG